MSNCHSNTQKRHKSSSTSSWFLILPNQPNLHPAPPGTLVGSFPGEPHRVPRATLQQKLADAVTEAEAFSKSKAEATQKASAATLK